jgi:hypothetical protein
MTLYGRWSRSMWTLSTLCMSSLWNACVLAFPRINGRSMLVYAEDQKPYPARGMIPPHGKQDDTEMNVLCILETYQTRRFPRTRTSRMTTVSPNPAPPPNSLDPDTVGTQPVVQTLNKFPSWSQVALYPVSLDKQTSSLIIIQLCLVQSRHSPK